MMDDMVTKATKFMVNHFADPEISREYYLPDVVVHHGNGTEWRGVEELIHGLSPSKFAGLEWPRKTIVDDCFATDNRVGLRFRVLFTLVDTGTVVTRHELRIFRLENGLIAEIWVYYDILSEQRQYERAGPG